MQLQTHPKNTPTPNTLPFEEKLYFTLRNIDSGFISEYLESFGLKEENIRKGVQLKEFADKMNEMEFVSALQNGSLPKNALSSVELEVLYTAAHDYTDDPACD